MKTILALSAAALIAAAAAAPVSGQTLSERIAAVKKKQAEKQERSHQTILQALLYGTVTADFDAAPARDVFDFLKTALDINLIVRSSDDPAGHGIDLNTPITLAGKNLNALEVLELVLEQCAVLESCSWQLRRGFLEVGTKDRLSVPAAHELRMYPVDEVLYQPRRFEDAPILRLDGIYDKYAVGYGSAPYYSPYRGGNFRRGGYGGSIQILPSGSADDKAERVQSLIDLITELVEPTGWARHGGEWARIAYNDGVLVIQAPDFIHRQIGGYPPVPAPKREAPDQKEDQSKPVKQP